MALLLPTKRIAGIELRGAIGGTVRPQAYLPLLERVRRSRRLSALVLAVDSPGGSAAASEELYLAVKSVAAVKPVVSFIRDRGLPAPTTLAPRPTRYWRCVTGWLAPSG